jgi:hypothetical protein
LASEQFEQYRKILERNIHGDSQEVSFVGKSRFLNSHTFNLERVIKDILEQCTNPANAELIIVVDKDDDLSVFAKIKQKYEKQLKIIFPISPVRHGYSNMHRYDKICYNYISKNSKVCVVTCDDVRIVMDDVDSELLKIYNQYPDEIFYICPDNKSIFNFREHYISLYGVDEIVSLYGMYFFNHGVLSAYPCFGTRLIKICQEVLDRADYLSEEEKSEWSPLGNSSFNDLQIDMIFSKLKLSGFNRLVYRNVLESYRPYVRVKINDKKNKFGLHAGHINMLRNFNSKTILHIDNIVKQMAQIIKSN